VSTFALIPGAGGDAWYWHRVVPLLEAAGHRAIAVDLPAADDDARLEDYADRVVEAIGKRKVVVVAQSLGGFTAPLVCARVAVEALVFVNAMIPMPGEKAGDWWGNTGSEKARVAAAKRGGYPAKYEELAYFFHDRPKKVTQGSLCARPRAVGRHDVRAVPLQVVAACADPRDRWAATTASSRSISSAVSLASGSAWRSSRSAAGTSSRFRIRRGW
jgi:pimeloyl-ACP methyl ester carboxylesterase